MAENKKPGPGPEAELQAFADKWMSMRPHPDGYKLELKDGPITGVGEAIDRYKQRTEDRATEAIDRVRDALRVSGVSHQVRLWTIYAITHEYLKASVLDLTVPGDDK